MTHTPPHTCSASIYKEMHPNNQNKKHLREETQI
jgi:hypothetical protein